MKVLHIIPRLSFRCGGPVKAMIGMAEAQARAGLDLKILATDHWYEGHPEIEGCEIKVFPCRFIHGWQLSPAFGRALPDELRWADVVNIHTMWSYTTLAAARACQRAGVPYILRPCGMLDVWSLSQKQWKKRLYAGLIERNNINRASSLWFTSEEERASARSFNYTCPDAVIPLGLPLNSYAQLPPRGFFRERYPQLAGRRVALFLGRITPVKQLDVLLRAFKTVSADFPDAALVIAGPDEDNHLSVLKQLVNELGMKNEVIFTGGLQGAEVQAALADAEMFVLPSLHENFGVAAVEAMASGIPVIVSDRVGLASYVSGARAGLVTPANERELAASLRAFLSDPALARRMGENGRHLALEKFTWDHIVSSIRELYTNVIRSHSRLKPALENQSLPIGS
ncbi:MAG: glycosyltransferase [Pyrinomonadaceae bacterium]